MLDPAQNHTFRDHYLELDLDLSDVLFLPTANVADTIPGPLLDRMEVVPLDGYTEEEKVAIGRDHPLPRQIEPAGLLSRRRGAAPDRGRAHPRGRCPPARPGTRQDPAEDRHGNQSGARRGRRPRALPRTAALNTGDGAAVPGVATGLAVTGAGGDVLFLEATAMDGEPGLTLTGQLGDESAQIAMSWLRSHGPALGIDAGALAGRRVHLHVRQAASRRTDRARASRW